MNNIVGDGMKEGRGGIDRSIQGNEGVVKIRVDRERKGLIGDTAA